MQLYASPICFSIAIWLQRFIAFYCYGIYCNLLPFIAFYRFIAIELIAVYCRLLLWISP